MIVVNHDMNMLESRAGGFIEMLTYQSIYNPTHALCDTLFMIFMVVYILDDNMV
jgi:hypothetical protein